MRSWFRIENKADDADVYIYDEIGFWGITAKSFIDAIKKVKGNITLHLNSPGGDVFDGIAIYNTLKNLSSKVTIKIEGLAASIASIIAMAGDSVEMADNSMMMIHNPHAFTGGDSAEFAKMAEVLNQIKSILISTYQVKSSLSEEEISKLMDDETWLDANDAKDKGFIDLITPAVKIKNNYQTNFTNSSKYKEWERLIKAPQDKQPGLPLPHEINKKGENMNQVFNLLGVETEEEVIAKINASKAANEELKAEIKALKEEALKNIVAMAIAEGKISEDQKEYAEKLIITDRELYDGFVAQVAKVKEAIPPKVPAKVEVANNAKGTGITWEELSKNPEDLANLKKSNPAEYQRLFENYMEENR